MLVNVPAPPVVEAVLAPPVVYEQARAPQPQQMSGTVKLYDIKDGWYGMEGCPTCCCSKIAFNHDKSAFRQGPCCCWQLPIPCTRTIKGQSAGSITFINDSGSDKFTWVTPTKYLLEQVGNSNHYSKMC